MRTSSLKKKGKLGEKQSKRRPEHQTFLTFLILPRASECAESFRPSALPSSTRKINGLYHIDSTEYSKIVSAHGGMFLSLQIWRIY